MYELGFFSPGKSKNRYLGIWFKKISKGTVVWVANRETPITYTSGMLKVSQEGNLAIHNGGNDVIWSSNSAAPTRSKDVMVQLLDSGNLVVWDKNSTNPTTIWQSFDYPTDTLLAGMRFGKDLVTGLERHVTSWKSPDDPSIGSVVQRIVLTWDGRTRMLHWIERTQEWIVFQNAHNYRLQDLHTQSTLEFSQSNAISVSFRPMSKLSSEQPNLEYDEDHYIFIKMPASELAGHMVKKRLEVLIMIPSILSATLLLSVVFCFCWKRKKILHIKKQGDSEYALDKKIISVQMERLGDIQFFSLYQVEKATENFSNSNKIGEGGFGPVYKGVLEDGLEVAVKRLSKTSDQGFDEFKNELISIAKLQHRNLVKLLGYCIFGDEMILIYEYMSNKSLDSFLFDDTRSSTLNWPRRYHIIHGMARGILYLHQDSRLQIIHRDLKAANILLDSDMNPKISDFGLARKFVGHDTYAMTKKVVGTHLFIANKNTKVDTYLRTKGVQYLFDFHPYNNLSMSIKPNLRRSLLTPKQQSNSKSYAALYIKSVNHTIEDGQVALDTISISQVIKDGETIVSSDDMYELGFFSPGKSKNRYLGIWFKKISKGMYKNWVDTSGYPQIFGRKGPVILFRFGPWNGLGFSGFPIRISNPVYSTEFVVNQREIYNRYEITGSVVQRIVLTWDGRTQMLHWIKRTQEWIVYADTGVDSCSSFEICGAYGSCSITKNPPCSCMEAYSNLDIRNGGSGCLLWFDELMDVREYDEDHNIYIKMPASELSEGHMVKKRIEVLIMILSTLSATLLLSAVVRFCWKRKKILYIKKQGELEYALDKKNTSVQKEHFGDIQFFSLYKVEKATENFSDSNKIGEGGFGPVYKGVMEDGLEVAVKRLSKTSEQGFDEFKNELISIAKLQHRNLVKLLGYCIYGDEMILIYEYMSNKSLDSFLFGLTLHDFNATPTLPCQIYTD
nr:putative S-locus glycoprotein domain-containing protein [Tanacetum cinerariifolium]